MGGSRTGPEPPDHLQHGVPNWFSEHKIPNQDHCRRARLVSPLVIFGGSARFWTIIFVLRPVSDQDNLLVFGLASGHDTMSGGLGGFEQPVDVLNMSKFIP